MFSVIPWECQALLVFVLTRWPVGHAAGSAMLAGYVAYVALIL